jgi:hypothetical protein
VGIKKVASDRIQVNFQDDVRQSIDPPSLLIHHPARAFWKVDAHKLLGITALTGEENVKKILEAAAALDESDERDWSHDDAQQILTAVGTLPAPSHVILERVKGEGTLVFRAVAAGAAGAKALTYPEGSRRPQISILAALRREGVQIPKGMAMEVPVKLVLTDDGISLAACLRRGKLREVSQVESSGEAQGAEK